MNAKELAEYVTEQLSGLDDVRKIPMMGGYIFYYKERIFGGISGSGFMVKITDASKKYMPDSVPEPPYQGAKPMFPVTILDDKEQLRLWWLKCSLNCPKEKLKIRGVLKNG